MIFVNLFLYVVSFICLWIGAGMIVNAATKFSRKLGLAPFIFSFAFLGILTSIPEFSVGLQSVADKNSQIFVGNLLGGIVVLFLVAIPLLAVFGNGINLKHELNHKQLLSTLGVILIPAVCILDKRITNIESIFMVVSYLLLLYFIQKKDGVFDKENEKVFDIKMYSYRDLFKILLGLAIVFIASNLIVQKTLYFADIIHIPAFYISLIVIALGTDLPELTLAVRSVLSGKKDLAMGDYIGAAAVSTLLFGILSLLNGGEVLVITDFFITFLFIICALGLFYFFSHVKQYLSRTNGLIMLGVYLLFLFFELYR